MLIENAYFVPRDHGIELVAGLNARGAKVRVLTNSLASNDLPAVHSGYQKYRDAMHAKVMVVDRRYVVVGSYNLDPRSADLNTELALLVDSPVFAEMVAHFFEEGSSRRTATGSRSTEGISGGRPATAARSGQADALGILPIHSML